MINNLNEFDLLQFNGATLEWEMFYVSHGLLWLTASGLAIGSGEILFGLTIYVDTFTKLHDVMIRKATNGEAEQFKLEIPSTHIRWLKVEDLFVIDSDEGRNYIWAEYCKTRLGKTMLSEYLAAENLSIDLINSLPLWKDGPSLDQL